MVVTCSRCEAEHMIAEQSAEDLAAGFFWECSACGTKNRVTGTEVNTSAAQQGELIECPECHATRTDGSATCPQCGATQVAGAESAEGKN